MTISTSTKKAIASSLLLGLAGLVALLNSSSTETSFIPSFRKLEGAANTLSAAFKPTGFYTSDIGFFTVKPWGPATWSVDFTTKSIKKLNSLLYSAEGEENHKGSILCTDELCQAHGKATTAVLMGAPSEMAPEGSTCLTAMLEIGADAFELCFTCPPGSLLYDMEVLSCMTDDTTNSNCLTNDSFTKIPAGPGMEPFFRTGRLFFRDQEEEMPNIVQMDIKFTCTPAEALEG